VKGALTVEKRVKKRGKKGSHTSTAHPQGGPLGTNTQYAAQSQCLTNRTNRNRKENLCRHTCRRSCHPQSCRVHALQTSDYRVAVDCPEAPHAKGTQRMSWTCTACTARRAAAAIAARGTPQSPYAAHLRWCALAVFIQRTPQALHSVL
jgi:hypothetical protein